LDRYRPSCEWSNLQFRIGSDGGFPTGKKFVNFRTDFRELGQRGLTMKKLVLLVTAALLTVSNVQAETSNPSSAVRPRFEVPASIKNTSPDAESHSARRVRGVFRVFGDDDEVGASPRANPPRRKSRRSSKARRPTETQKTRGSRPTSPQPDGILVLLDGIPPAL
jgi:hypothetical protein